MDPYFSALSGGFSISLPFPLSIPEGLRDTKEPDCIFNSSDLEKPEPILSDSENFLSRPIKFKSEANASVIMLCEERASFPPAGFSSFRERTFQEEAAPLAPLNLGANDKAKPVNPEEGTSDSHSEEESRRWRTGTGTRDKYTFETRATIVTALEKFLRNPVNNKKSKKQICEEIFVDLPLGLQKSLAINTTKTNFVVGRMLKILANLKKTEESSKWAPGILQTSEVTEKTKRLAKRVNRLYKIIEPSRGLKRKERDRFSLLEDRESSSPLSDTIPLAKKIRLKKSQPPSDSDYSSSKNSSSPSDLSEYSPPHSASSKKSHSITSRVFWTYRMHKDLVESVITKLKLYEPMESKVKAETFWDELPASLSKRFNSFKKKIIPSGRKSRAISTAFSRLSQTVIVEKRTPRAWNGFSEEKKESLKKQVREANQLFKRYTVS